MIHECGEKNSGTFLESNLVETLKVTYFILCDSKSAYFSTSFLSQEQLFMERTFHFGLFQRLKRPIKSSFGVILSLAFVFRDFPNALVHYSDAQNLFCPNQSFKG